VSSRQARSPVSPAIALLPLRLFLGVTFVYAGIQKLSDPGFFHAGAPTYIGTQLHGFAAGTPGGFVLRAFALPHPELAGAAVAVAEILIGILAATGLFTRAAAACGLGLNFLLFLTASWHTTPYFLGPDLVFSFAWLPFVLAGSEGQPALDSLLRERPEAVSRRTRLRPPSPATEPAPGSENALTRRVVLTEFAGIAIAIAGISALVKGSYSPPKTIAAGGGSPTAGGTGSGSGSSPGSAGSGRASPGSLPEGAVRLAPSSRVRDGQAATYSDPADGSPDILIRSSEGDLRAFSAVCTHAGCTVGYEGGIIYCPCHGGEYSAETGEVIAGPPPSGLTPRRVLESGGSIYAIPS
jgi:thiosulfate dehydrogenase [quinone] large subunit